MAFPQQADKMNIRRILALGLAILLPVLGFVSGEPDALIRFADGSVVEIENRMTRQNNIQDLPLPQADQLLPGKHHLIAPGRALSDEHHRIVTRANVEHYCGNHLINAMTLLCQNKYKKRSRTYAADNDMQKAVYSSDNEQSLQNFDGEVMPDFFELLKSSSGHHRMLVDSGNEQAGSAPASLPSIAGQQPKPSKRGIVEECCKSACSLATLQSYCS